MSGSEGIIRIFLMIQNRQIQPLHTPDSDPPGTHIRCSINLPCFLYPITMATSPQKDTSTRVFLGEDLLWVAKDDKIKPLPLSIYFVELYARPGKMPHFFDRE